MQTRCQFYSSQRIHSGTMDLRRKGSGVESSTWFVHFQFYQFFKLFFSDMFDLFYFNCFNFFIFFIFQLCDIFSIIFNFFLFISFFSIFPFFHFFIFRFFQFFQFFRFFYFSIFFRFSDAFWLWKTNLSGKTISRTRNSYCDRQDFQIFQFGTFRFLGSGIQLVNVTLWRFTF